jgi:hypothetical protein
MHKVAGMMNIDADNVNAGAEITAQRTINAWAEGG